MSAPRLALLVVLFFTSGAVGLVDQVVWVRQLGLVFGNTVGAAAMVSGLFTFGLGVGALLGGRVADRLRGGVAGPTRAYGVAELFIGAFALGFALLLPWLVHTGAPRFTSYVTGAEGWSVVSPGSWALRAALVVAVLLPITALMGATLTLLVRAVLLGALDRAGARVGVLYGANTLGAAAGCLATDFAFIPALGVQGTLVAAAVGNLVVGAVALFTLGRSAGTEPPVAPRVEPTTTEPAPRAAVSRRALFAALFCAGFAGLGFEVLWFRHLSSGFGHYRSVFSLLLFVMLACMGVGSVVGGRLHRRGGSPSRLFVLVQCAVAATGLLPLIVIGPRELIIHGFEAIGGVYVPGAASVRLVFDLILTVGATLVFVGLPSFFMGFAFPLGNAMAQDSEVTTGRTAGTLFLATAIGNLCGAWAAGFVLLPALGAQAAFALVGAVAAAAAVVLLVAEKPRLDGPLGGALVAVTSTLVAFSFLPHDHLVRQTFVSSGVVEVEAISEGANEVVVVGREVGGARSLFTDGHPMSSTSLPAQRYMRALSHVPLLLQDEPRNALVICFGVGNTVHAASLHPQLTRIDVADLSANVLSHAEWFLDANHDVLSDPRVRVVVNDGRNHLAQQPESTYDLITLEPPPISFAGVSSLYSRDFYALAKSRLSERGVMTQWLPAYQVPDDTALGLVKAFTDVFPDAVLLQGQDKELILLGARGDGLGHFVLADVARRLAARPAAAADLARVDLATAEAIAAMFLADAEALRAATASSLAVTDDDPRAERGTITFASLRGGRLPRAIFAPERLAQWCPECATQPEVMGRNAVLRHVTKSEHYLQAPGGPGPQPFITRALDDAPPDVLAAARASTALSSWLKLGVEAGDAPGAAAP